MAGGQIVDGGGVESRADQNNDRLLKARGGADGQPLNGGGLHALENMKLLRRVREAGNALHAKDVRRKLGEEARDGFAGNRRWQLKLK